MVLLFIYYYYMYSNREKTNIRKTYAVSRIPTEEKDIAPMAQAESGRR